MKFSISNFQFLKHRKFFALFFIVLFVAPIYGGMLLFPQRANAQFVPVGTTRDIPRNLSEHYQAAQKKLIDQKQTSAAQILHRILLNFTARISASIGKTLAEGATGGGSFFDTASLTKGLKDAGDAALGDAIDALGAGIGVNLCLPPDIRLNLSLRLGKILEPPKPKCTFQEFQNKWREFGESFSDEEIFSQRFSAGLDPSQSEIALAAHTELNTEAEQAEAKRQKEIERLYGKGWKGVTDPISGDVKTPPGILEEQGKVQGVVKIPGLEKPPELTGNIGTDLGKIVGYNFFTAFLQTAVPRLIAGMFQPQPPKPSRRGIFGSLGSGSGGAKAPDVQVVSFSATGSEFDLLAEFTICPDVGASIYNCVLDQNFGQAIRDGMTIREAVKNDFTKRVPGAPLNVTLPFGYGGTTGEERLRHDSGYAAHNLKKLRRARIIPVGWEIAAEIVKAQRQPAPTFGEVLQGFNNPDSSFYRLVDPDWLLKTPLYYCQATAPGQLLAAPGSEDRMEYCVDLQDCVVPTDDGNGCQSWGYCTREKNTWRFDARACPVQFNTCLSYKRGHDSQIFAFNKNTTRSCDASEVGCRWYALEKQGTATWKSTPRRYFNRTVSECAAQADGCTEFARLTDKTAGKPLTVAQYTAAKDGAVAAKKNYEDYSAEQNATFATKRLTIKYLDNTLNDCRGPQGNEAANVGCERFTPTTGVDAPVPAVLKPNDACPSACVGYDAYEEVATLFSKGNFPEYFIPSAARTCSADVVGCEEFTNLDAVGLGGEARENFTALRHCQKPATDSRTYYTWVGTEKTGYQLETHSLKASNLDGGKAPCTTRDMQNGNVCNEAVSAGVDTRASCAKADLLTNPDCREFYDAQGNISYRLYSKTIVSSDACIRYRMTRSEGRENCNETGGEWNGASCIYLALPQENRSCSAEAVGCREYKGNTANDIRAVLNESFETTKDAQGAVIRPPAWTTGTISTVSLTQNGHSLASDGGRIAVGLTDAVQEGRTYILSLWATGVGGNVVVDPLLTSGAGKETRFERFSLSTNWQKYTLGPVFVTWKPDTAARLEMNAESGVPFVIDTVTLTEVRDDFYLIKDSWTTPRECLYKDDGSLRAGDDRVVGCRAYTDRAKNPYAVKSFRQLCREEFVGCEALINTQNTTKPESHDFPNTSAETRDDVTIPADTMAYVVNDPKNYCAQSEKGCSAMSAPQVRDQGASFAAPVVYRLNDPEQYRDTPGKGSILCTAPNLACEAYTKSAGGEDYFIDPYVAVTAAGEPTTCEWKQLPDTLAQQFGWFKKGSSAKTPDCGAPTADGSGTPPDYVRECSAAADRCTQFIDPQDLSRSTVSVLLTESFEATAPPPGWNALAPAQLTTVDGGIVEARALRAEGGRPEVLFTLGTTTRHGPIQKGGAYRLSFWMKGNGGTLVTRFGGAPANGYFQQTGGANSILVTSNWTHYNLTRVATADESVAAQTLNFEGGGGLTSLFLDGIQLEAITDSNDTGRPFYVIDDEALAKKRDRTLCSVVDQKAGCVLFNTENKGVAQWDSTLSYQAGTPVACTSGETVCVGARDTNNGKVYGRGTDATACAANGGKGVVCIGPDTNDLIKVQRDRVCGEWLSCLSGTQVFDKQTQKTRDICYAVGSCVEPSVYNATACGKMKDVDVNPQFLDVTLYKTRDLTWKGQEYVGHSIPYQYPVTSFVQLPYNINAETKIPEGYRLHTLVLKRDSEGAPVRCTAADKDTTCGKGPNKICRFLGKTISALTKGYCYDDQGSGRAFSWDPTTKSPAANAPRLREIAKSCRAYPATDAPFPASDSIVAEWQGTTVTLTDETTGRPKERTTGDDEPEFLRPFRKEDAYRAANVSQQLSQKKYTYNEAECSYREVRYTDGETRFWGARGTYPYEIVQGSGVKRDAVQLKYGWQGYCLETDPGSPTPIENADGRKEACLTWFPALVAGEIDVNTNAPEAGYQVASENRFYCVETREEELRIGFGMDKKTKSFITTVAPYAIPALSAFSFGIVPGIIAAIPDVQEFASSLTSSGGGPCLSCPSGYYPSSCWKTSSHIKTICTPVDANILQVGDGWYPYDGLLPTESYRKICTKVALVSDATDRNLGWAERLKGPIATNPRLYTDHPMSYPIKQLSTPYGAADVTGFRQEKENTFQICTTDPVTNKNACDALVVEGVGALDAPHAKSPYVKKTFNLYADAKERETHRDGVSRLQSVFARVFGVWEYVPKQSSCAPRCSGGVYSAYFKTCNPDSSVSPDPCPVPSSFFDPDDPNALPVPGIGACIPAIKKVCKGGTSAGAICTLDSTICTDTGGTCEPVDPSENVKRRVCTLGANPGQDCSFDSTLCVGGGTCTDTGTTLTSVCDNGVNTGVECSQDATICSGAGTCKKPSEECTIPEKSFVPIAKELVWDSAGPDNTFARGPKVRAAEYDLKTQSYSEKKVCEGGTAPGAICTFNPNICKEGKCVADPNPGITVETKSSGDFKLRTTAQGVSVKFYAYNENGEQMPLQRVIVDWGDENELSTTQGSLKNRKNTCQRFCKNATVKNAENIDVPKHCNRDEDCGGTETAPDSCVIANWGDDVNACIEDTPGGGSGYFTYTHIYRCVGPTSFGWDENYVDPNDPGNKGACVFKPRVQVLDNWGWCNGTCGAKGCYNDPAGERQCETNDRAWTPYAGRIIMKP